MSSRVLEKPLNFPQLSLGIIKLRGKYKLEDSTGPSTFNQRPTDVFTCIISMTLGMSQGVLTHS